MILIVRNTCTESLADIGSNLLFRFRFGTHGLNEELSRHSTRNSIKSYRLSYLFFCTQVSKLLLSDPKVIKKQ